MPVGLVDLLISSENLTQLNELEAFGQSFQARRNTASSFQHLGFISNTGFKGQF